MVTRIEGWLQCENCSHNAMPLDSEFKCTCSKCDLQRTFGAETIDAGWSPELLQLRAYSVLTHSGVRVRLNDYVNFGSVLQTCLLAVFVSKPNSLFRSRAINARHREHQSVAALTSRPFILGCRNREFVNRSHGTDNRFTLLFTVTGRSSAPLIGKVGPRPLSRLCCERNGLPHLFDTVAQFA
jgi:hypothetical protein